MPDLSQPILFFDGECNLCNRVVQFIIRRDRKKQFRFASLQSQAALHLPTHLRSEAGKAPDSIILFSNNRYYLRSAAALHTARLLGGVWSLLFVFMVVPRFLRDAVYDLIARNRYKWFGKRQCMVPGPGIAERFLK